MRLPLTALAMALASAVAAGGLGAQEGREDAASASPGALLYLDRSHWREARGEQKIALATDFMRVFCGNPAMPPSTLVACLDEVSGSGSIFESALACVAGGPAAPKP
jgi:hypothetical protein